MKYICANGDFFPSDRPVITIRNRAFRYGDGLFETMKIADGKICLEKFHFERLLSGISLLQYEAPVSFATDQLRNCIIELCRKNECLKQAKVRLSVSGGEGGLYDADNTLQYVIEAEALNDVPTHSASKGLHIGVYRDCRKGNDVFANLKTVNFLPYVMAAKFAKANGLNDCLVLNTEGFIADATIANLFIIKDNRLFTPALTEGCVNGVMRRFLLEQLPGLGYMITETRLSSIDVEEADEVFLTNAIRGIQWVKKLEGRQYINMVSSVIVKQLEKFFN